MRSSGFRGNSSSRSSWRQRANFSTKRFIPVRGLRGRWALPVVAFAAGVSYLGYRGFVNSDFYQQSLPINDELSSASVKMAYRNNLVERFDQSHEEEFERIAYRSIFEAIEANDVEQIGESLHILFEERKVPLTKTMRDEMIVYASNHDKVQILEYFTDIFGYEAVSRNKHARMILDLSDEEKDTYEYMTEQFHQSPGKIKYDGMLLYVDYAQDKTLQATLEYQAYDPVITGDLESDMIESARHLESRRRIRAEMKDKFKHTAIIDTDFYGEDQQEYKEFLERLRDAAVAENQTKVGTFMFTGTHFTIGQAMASVKVEVDGEKKTAARVLFIDPLGSHEFSIMGTYYSPYAGYPDEVFDEAHTQVSTELLQTRKNGCSIFTGYLYKEMITADYILAANSQYAFAGEKNALFAYASMTEMAAGLAFGYDYLPESGNYAKVGRYSFFRLPAFMTTHKQTYGASGNMKDVRVFEYVEKEDGTFEEIINDAENIHVPGRKGIQVDMDTSDEKRKQEFDGPVEVGSSDTVKQRIGALTFFSEFKGKIKPQNKRNDLVAYDMGHDVGKYLLEDDDALQKAAEYRNSMMSRHN